MRIHQEPMLSTVLRRLDDKKGSWPEVAKACGVPYQTLTKIACRIHCNPRIGTLQPLYDDLTSDAEEATAADCGHAAH